MQKCKIDDLIVTILLTWKHFVLIIVKQFSDSSVIRNSSAACDHKETIHTVLTDLNTLSDSSSSRLSSSSHLSSRLSSRLSSSSSSSGSPAGTSINYPIMWWIICVKSSSTALLVLCTWTFHIFISCVVESDFHLQVEEFIESVFEVFLPTELSFIWF